MNLDKKIRNQSIIFGIVILLVFSSTSISTIFSYKARNDINEDVNTIRTFNDIILGTSSVNTWITSS